MLGRITKWTKKRFYAILKRKNTSEGNEEITITNIVTSVTKDVTNAELNFAAGEIKNHNSPKQHQNQIQENVKREAWKHTPII